MKRSVFYHHVVCAAAQQNLPVETMLSKVRALGIPYVELDNRDIRDPEALGRMLMTSRMQVSSIYCFYEWGRDPEDFQEWAQLANAKRLGAREVMVIPGLYDSEEKTEREKTRQRMLQAMKAFCERAGREGLTTTIEDFDDAKSPIATIEGMKWFADRIPLLKIVLDTGNFFYSGQDVRRALTVFAGRIVHVHCKDRYVGAEGERFGERTESALGIGMYPCPTGSGCIPIRQCIEELSEKGFDGIYAIEHFGAADYWSSIQDSAKWLRGLAVAEA